MTLVDVVVTFHCNVEPVADAPRAAREFVELLSAMWEDAPAGTMRVVRVTAPDGVRIVGP